jgi:hypothetical protein
MLPSESFSDESLATPMLPAERRLAESRAEIERLLKPGPDTFPRSETMRFLMGGKGKFVALGVFAGLFAVKPRLALSLVRFLPLDGLLPIGRILQRLR